MKLSLYKLTILLIILLPVIPVQIKADDWKAVWISTDHCQSEPNTWLNYRKNINLPEKPQSAPTQIAADSKYWLWINGELVIFEGGLKRGPNPADTYYDELDLAPWLRKGNNTIAIQVCYFGKQGFSHNSSGKAGLLFQCRADNILITSDRTWKCFINNAYKTAPEPHPNYRLSESNILYDARQEPEEWYLPAYNDSHIPPASELATAGSAPWNKLVKRPIPQWKNEGIKPYTHQYRSGDTLICQLPYNAQVTPWFKIKAPAGKKIVMGTDNYFFYNGSVENIRAEYITKEGEQTYESYGWMNGHKMYYILPSDIEIIETGYRETGYGCTFAGSFHSSDDFLNQLWTKAARTLYVNMRDTYMDCPERERAQWTGDAVIQSAEAFYALSSESHQLTKKWLQELAGWQKPDGTIFAPVPAGNWNIELPGQVLSSVGIYGLWNYYMYTGDKNTLSAIYPAVKKYMSVWQINEEGTINFRETGWVWGDWGSNRDILLILNTFYYLAAQNMHLMAVELGYEKDKEAYNNILTRFKEGFNRQFWTGTAYRDPAYTGKNDDRVQALAVLSGLADKDKYKKLLRLFQTEKHASPYMEKYIFEAMMKMGYENEAINRHKERMSDMVWYPGFTTLFEHWEIGEQGFGSGSVNHGWTGGGLVIASQYIAGIAPLTPGYQTASILPHPGNIEEVTAIVPTIRGEIKNSFRNSKKQFSMHTTIPSGIEEAIIGIPAGKIREIRLNGTTVWKNGKYIKTEEASLYTSQEKKHIKFLVKNGTYRFEAFY